MYIDFDIQLSEEERKSIQEKIELALSVTDTVQRLYDNHRATYKKWYPHLILPWGQGQDFNEVAWAESQASLRPEVRVALETNLLTEDNLPYYHAYLERFLAKDPIWSKWNRRWTSEEGKHASVLRDYLYLTRNFDPVELEDNRQTFMEIGFERNSFDAISIFVYTTIQELATRVSHANTGTAAEDPTLKTIMNHLATDENFHYVFYRGVVKAMLEQAPEIVLPGLVKEAFTFSMPGAGLKDFKRRMEVIAELGVYGPREHRDTVIKPLWKYWDLENLKGLSPEGRKLQEKALGLIKVLDRVVERRERKPRKTDPETTLVPNVADKLED